MGNSDYKIGNSLPAESVNLEFDGRFEGKVVRWKACFRSLGEGNQPGSPARPYIDISTSSEGYAIEVGLPVSIIDLPTVKKGIIMVKNYKRLRLGRHEFGDSLLSKNS